MFAIREYLVLARQVGAAGVHQVDARQAVLAGDGLGAQVLLHRQWVVGAAFHRGVVGHDHAFHALYTADAGDHPGCRHVLAVDVMGGELADLEEGRACIEQAVDAFARQQLAARGMALLRLGPAALLNAGEQGAQVVHLGEHGGLVGGELR